MFAERLTLRITVNGDDHELPDVDARTTLLDLLREHLDLTGAKKGCNRGECGACTVLLDGRQVTTVEGLGEPDALHPVQRAFIDHDAFQCGFCTPGQVISAVACIGEGHASDPEEIREWMSGNICRCSSYPQIVAAVQAAAAELGERG